MEMITLLIVEDDRLLSDGIAFSLRHDGYEVLQAYTGEAAQVHLEKRPDLIVLDINLPDTNGLELCRRIRQTLDTTIIFLTAKDTEQEILQGFKAGADDFISKPFSLPVLKERIKAVLKRKGTHANVLICNNLAFDKHKLTLTRDGEEIPLTATEVKLVKLFFEHRGKVLTRAQILENVWDLDGDFVDENALSVNIRRLRSKIEADPSHPVFIKTVFGIGYIWGDIR